MEADADAVNLALLAFRVMLGAIFLAHGVNHVFRGGKIEGTAGWFESLGMKPGLLHAWLASLVEIAVGVAAIVGLAMPLAGAGMVGVMLVAWITNHRTNGFFIFRPGEGWEYVMSLAVSGFVLAVLGAGEWSVDHALDLYDNGAPGALGAATALLGGVGGALALLAVFWRPPTAEDGD